MLVVKMIVPFFYLHNIVNGGFLPLPSPASTIPAFPEQSAVSACPISLPDALFPSVAGACSASGGRTPPRSRCCPTLAAWLYSAYSPAAPRWRAGYCDMPLLPDDTETCVSELARPWRSRRWSCPDPTPTATSPTATAASASTPSPAPPPATPKRSEAWSFTANSTTMPPVAASASELSTRCKLRPFFFVIRLVQRLKLCDQKEGAVVAVVQLKDRYPADRTGDCELMGLTWLLAKDRAAYMAAVTHVLRTFMAAGGDASWGRRRKCRWRWTRRSGGRRIPPYTPYS